MLRKYRDKIDNFARIVFVNEQEDKDFYDQEISEYLLDYQVKSRLKRGVSIGNCIFEFLAYSNSQIKNHSFWMHCNDFIDNSEIRRGLGIFNQGDKQLKRQARIGQNFSSTK